MLKIHESFDNNISRTNKEKEEKEPGFKRLEYHKKNLILNASALPSFDQAADEPTEFYKNFLQKKTQFKAKDFLMHRLQVDNISYHPSSLFVNCLWNADFLWLTPDFPAGLSIFFCPAVSLVNSYELERDRNLALVDKIKQSDIEKLSKEKFSFPDSIMDMVWLTQNYHAIVSLCFGEKSHLAKFLKDWGNHMYSNHLLYKSQQASNSSFFTQVLFCIDNALQIHWCTCCKFSDRESVNDRILLMSEKRDLIIQYNFTYNIPKLLQDKLIKPKPTDTGNKDEKDKEGKGNKLKGDKDNKNKFKSLKDIVTDNDPKHAHWHLQDGENFSKIFYCNQKKCPKTKDGKLICMKLFIRGICDLPVPFINKPASNSPSFSPRSPIVNPSVSTASSFNSPVGTVRQSPKGESTPLNKTHLKEHQIQSPPNTNLMEHDQISAISTTITHFPNSHQIGTFPCPPIFMMLIIFTFNQYVRMRGKVLFQ
jgi:hypothetical protein